MWAIFLSIVGCYALAAIVVHIAARRHAGLQAAHYVLFAGHHAERIEWYLRRLRRWSRRTGRDVRVTVVACEAGETAGIAERFARGSEAVKVMRPLGAEAALAPAAKPAAATVGEVAAAGATGEDGSVVTLGQMSGAGGTACGEGEGSACGDRGANVSTAAQKAWWKRLLGVETAAGPDHAFIWKIAFDADALPGRIELVDLGDPTDVASLP